MIDRIADWLIDRIGYQAASGVTCGTIAMFGGLVVIWIDPARQALWPLFFYFMLGWTLGYYNFNK